MIAALSNLIVVAIEPITGLEVRYSVLREILIGPITALAELENRIADIEAARIRFLVNIMTPYL